MLDFFALSNENIIQFLFISFYDVFDIKTALRIEQFLLHEPKNTT